jgi:murein L,D-transpeptidase YcbB/YkuD
VRIVSTVGVVLALIASPAGTALAQVAGQSTLLPPQPVPAKPSTKPAAIAKPQQPAKPAQPAKSPSAPPSTPESRSAAALALSADPVFDEGTYQRIKETLLSYSAIQVRGGWPTLPADAKLAPGVSGPAVALLRQRLAISDDMSFEQAEGDVYDDAVVEGVKRFQLRHGLEATGSVGAQTLRALNVPVDQRLKQLEASLERLMGMDFVFADRYVVVNIPAAFVEAVAHDKVERRYRVIVGKVDKPSPTLTAYITAVVLNPTWTVPLSITKNEIFRHMRRDPSYLSRMHMRVLGARDEEISPQSVDWSSDRSPNFTIRQDAGGWNALGNLKIDMPNPYSVYMHDTDARRLFADDYRFDSHGCTRVDNVRDLAAWILQDVPPWNRAAIDAGIATGETRTIALPRKMPVAWVYLTGWVRRDGVVEFRDDVYKHDDALDRAALDETIRAGGFVQVSAPAKPAAGPVKQVSNLDSR